MKHFLPLVSFLILVVPASAEDIPFLKGVRRIVFLGDSNTYAGKFIVYLDGYLATRFPDRTFELLNLGLPSETCTGLTEEDHPFPRPDVHERLDRVLAKTKPDLVIACYGMNDGIYHPFSEERFKAFQKGIEKLVEKVQKSGAKVMLMTPAPFDPVPLKDKVQTETAKDFSYRKPFAKYDEVLGKYSEWLLTLRGKDISVADPHTSINGFLRTERQKTPGFFVSGDGIHPNDAGHRRIAEAVLQTWKAPGDLTLRADLEKVIGERQQLWKLAWLTETGHLRPGIPKGLPLAEAEKKAGELNLRIRELGRK